MLVFSHFSSFQGIPLSPTAEFVNLIIQMQVKNNSFILLIFLLLFTIALLLCTRYTGICYQHSTWKSNHPFSYTLILSYFSVNIFYSKPDFLHSKQKKYKHLSKSLTCYWYATSLEFSANFASRL